jgi:hypothetical protein
MPWNTQEKDEVGELLMRPLRYSINITLDGCCDHQAGSTDEELHRSRRGDAL